MGAVLFRTIAEIRRGWKTMLALALVAGLGSGAVIAAGAGARRTDSAYSRFLKASNPATALIPNSGASFGFADIDFDKVVRFPEVAETARMHGLIATGRTSNGLTLLPIGGQNEFVAFAGDDITFDRVLNRMHAIAGRLASPDTVEEVTVSYDFQTRYHTRVGDSIDLTLFRPEDLKDITQIPKPSGPTVPLRVVGVETSPGELPPGLGYPPIHLTPAFTRKYLSGPSALASFDGLEVRLRNDADLPAFRERIDREAITPGPGGSRSVVFFAIPESGKPVLRSTHLQAVALWLLALLMGLAVVLVLAQGVSRQVFLDAVDNGALRSLGMSRRQLVGVSVVRTGITSLAAAVVAVAVAYALSPLTPIGLARVVEVRRGLAFDAVAFGIGAAALLILFVVVTVPSALRAARAATETEDTGRLSKSAESLASASFPPTSVVGVRLAFEPGRGTTAVPVRTTILGVAIAIASVVAALSFATSLDHLLHTPRLAGWTWDLALGDNFDPDTSATVIPILRNDPRVAAFSAGAQSNIAIARVPIDVQAMDTIQGRIDPAVLEGRAPESADEIALGSKTLREIHAHVGQTVIASVGNRTKPLRIVGRIIAPPVGDSRGLSRGGVMSFTALRALIPDAARDEYEVRVAPGVHIVGLVASLRERLTGTAVIQNPAQAGSDIAEYTHVTNLPLVLAGLLAILAAATLSHTLITSVRRRRRVLAILRSIGFVRRQVSATVAWQSTTIGLVSLVLAIPIGVIFGRWLWTVFANALGTRPEPIVDVWATALIVPATLLLANVIAFWPGRRAARVEPAVVLRTE